MELIKRCALVFLAIICNYSGSNPTTEAQTLKIASKIALGVAICAAPCAIHAQSYIGQGQSGGSSTRFDFSEPKNQAHGTVNVGIALSEGIILAADSRLTLITSQTFPGYMVLSDNNNKVFAVGNFGISTYGEAFLQNRTISSWVADYSVKTHKPSDDVDAFARRFSDYINDLYVKQYPEPKDQTRILGFLIAGYDSNGKGKLLSVEFPATKTPLESSNTSDKQGAQWRGDTDTIVRLVKGYDPRIGTLAAWNDIPSAQKDAIAKQENSLEYNIPWNALMLQDGVDFATSLVKMTVTFQRFSFGTVGNAGAIPSVGGAVDVLVVRPTGIEWVKQKSLVSN
jgi:Proteasome subunit